MKRLLLCLDASPRAPHVLEVGVDLARRTGSKLTLFRSVGIPPEMGQDVIGLSSSEIIERMLAAAKKDLAEHAAKIPPDGPSPNDVSSSTLRRRSRRCTTLPPLCTTARTSPVHSSPNTYAPLNEAIALPR